MKQKKVWLTCGTPGSGKSTWIQKQLNEKPGVWCSRDKVRFAMIKDGDEYFAKEDEVFEAWVKQIQEAIADSEGPIDIYIDATHLNVKSRAKVLSRLNLKDVELHAVNFSVPLEECIRRNELREGRARVPRSVIRRMHATFKPVMDNYENNYFYKEIIHYFW